MVKADRISATTGQEPVLVLSGDGSHTLYNRDLDQHYHSTFGAIQESMFIYIEAGFHHALQTRATRLSFGSGQMNILEIGFGTGLNALLTLMESEKTGVRVRYSALEAYPVADSCWRALNYTQRAGSSDSAAVFEKLHLACWDNPEQISDYFILDKIHADLLAFIPEAGTYDLVYFDAFGPDAQAELWTVDIFRKIADAMLPGGLLVTYSVKGSVVRALKSAGFQTEKMAGPPGKRHILRATLATSLPGSDHA